jgi:HAD superfamily hydrolase (TIGR01490 family)
MFRPVSDADGHGRGGTPEGTRARAVAEAGSTIRAVRPWPGRLEPCERAQAIPGGGVESTVIHENIMMTCSHVGTTSSGTVRIAGGLVLDKVAAVQSGPQAEPAISSAATARGTGDSSSRTAAFFDLDKTVIAKASMVAFSGPLHRAGLISRRMFVRAAWGQLIYSQFGASPEKLDKLRDSVLRLTRGWDQATISAIVQEALVEVVEPIVFDEALELIGQHQAAGRMVFIVSASPEEVVAPLARYLGVDEAIATRAELDDRGRYTGRTELYCYGPNKRVAIEQVADRDGIDLAQSYAYSDSATDLPMLEAVGHPVAVNPDRELRRAARARQWEIRRFTHRVPLRERVPMPEPRQAAVGGGAVLLALVAALGARWWIGRSRVGRRQTPTPLVKRAWPRGPRVSCLPGPFWRRGLQWRRAR